MTAEPVVRMEGITKAFPGVLANDGVDLDLYPGEIHAVVGENGAGKTTLMKILYGMYRPDSGMICMGGRTVHLESPRQAIALGIGMVHQHFMLVPSFTVAENVVLGYEPGRSQFISRRQAESATRDLCRRFGVEMDPAWRTGDLSVGRQQRVEILKALYRGARILILDEPTAVLTPQEADDLFRMLRGMAEQGTTVVFISHKLREVLEISRRITVMRQGRAVAHLATGETSRQELARLMTGRDQVFTAARPADGAAGAEPVLELEGVSTRARTGSMPLREVSLAVRRGEIVGVAAVEGNGQSDLVEAAAGMLPLAAGRIRLGGRDITADSIAARRRLGLAYVPEDRHAHGLPLAGTVAEALIATRSAAGGWGWATPAFTAETRAWAGDMIREYDVRTPGLDTACASLSGGNQQKLVSARELSGAPACLVLAQPTRGVDVGASDFLYHKILQERQRGCAILLVSADLDELFLLSDRLVVMYEGQITAHFDTDAVDPVQVGLYMTGALRAGPPGEVAP